MDRRRLLQRVDKAWLGFKESFAGLSDSQILEAGVQGRWSVRDILAHVTTWEEEALTHLPLILEGGRPPRYSTTYGGIDAFNALMTARKRDLSLPQVRRQLDEVHGRLIDYVHRALKSCSPGRRAFAAACGSTRMVTTRSMRGPYEHGGNDTCLTPLRFSIYSEQIPNKHRNRRRQCSSSTLSANSASATPPLR